MSIQVNPWVWNLNLTAKSFQIRLSMRKLWPWPIDGGILLLGVEDDGTITGANPRHGKTTDSLKIRSAIFNNTVPNLDTSVSVLNHPQGQVLAIRVSPCSEPCATASGKSLRRNIGPDGKPQTVPFYPRDQRSRRVDLGLMDFSAQIMDGVTFSDLDPLEFERLRQSIIRLRGDQALLDLSNEELAKALRLVGSRSRKLHPNLAGLLLLGKADVLEKVLPTHNIYFQVLDSQGNVKVNDAISRPLISAMEELGTRFAARNEEQEIQVGLVRLPVPDFAPEGFREAVNNAILHRDYSRLGAVYIQWHPDHLFIANPGGFPPGISVDNILVHEPVPRNPRLAEAFKRVGFVEQTGRGVDKIYMGQLHYGRPIPDYGRSDSEGVRVLLRGGEASLQFAAFVYEQNKLQKPLSLNELLAINHLFFERRVDSEIIGRLIQKGTTEGHAVLERLVERGLLQSKGEKRGRAYHLAAPIYAKLGLTREYVRSRGFEPIQQEQMILQYIDAHAKITRADVSSLCMITVHQASKKLKKMCDKGLIQMAGKPPKGAYYIRIAKR